MLGIHIPVISFNFFMKLRSLPWRDRETETYKTIEKAMVFIMTLQICVGFSNHIRKLLSLSVLCSVDAFFCSNIQRKKQTSIDDSCFVPILNCEEMSPAVKCRDVRDDLDFRTLCLGF